MIALIQAQIDIKRSGSKVSLILIVLLRAWKKSILLLIMIFAFRENRIYFSTRLGKRSFESAAKARREIKRKFNEWKVTRNLRCLDLECLCEKIEINSEHFFLYLHRVKESNQTSNVALAWFIEPQRSDLWWLISQKFIDTAISPPPQKRAKFPRASPLGIPSTLTFFRNVSFRIVCSIENQADNRKYRFEEHKDEFPTLLMRESFFVLFF